MTQAKWDVIFMGGGLAAGLAAYRLHLVRPELNFLMIEARQVVKDEQTWSFQSLPASIDPTSSKAFVDPKQSWLAPLLGGAWERYDIKFPKLKRTLETPYFSIRAAHFQDYLQNQFPHAWRKGEDIIRWGNNFVETRQGNRFEAPCIIDSRGWTTSRQRPCGYQKFLGLQVRTSKPHGVTQPLIMDAMLPQEDGFRFIYVLPWSHDELLIEDTHYSDTPDFDESQYEAKIRAYAAKNDWDIAEVLGRERGSLPIPYHGEPLPRSKDCLLGVRAGLFHATTGYSIYEAVLAAETLARIPRLETATARQHLARLSRRRWQQQSFYRRLNNMLFKAAVESERYKILESFYRHSQDLLARFYAGHPSWGDKLLIIARKPPIPFFKGMYYFFYTFGARHGIR